MNEIEEMRQQMNILKEKLNKQEIVNDNLMKSAISHKIDKIKRQRWIKRFIMVFAILYCPWMIYKLLEYPLWYALATIAMILIAFIYEEVYSNGTTSDNMSRQGLMETCEKLIRMKKMNKRWFFIGIPMLLLWIGGFYYLGINNSELSEVIEELTLGLVIGVVAGGMIGIMMYLKTQQSATDLIDNIQEYKKDMEE